MASTSSSALVPVSRVSHVPTPEQSESDTTMSARIGSYLLGECVRETLSGPVFRATHASTGMDVEIKMLPKEDERSDMAELRIKREVGALKRLQHPNVLRVWAVGRENGQPFLVMERIPGRTLEEWLNELGRFGVADAINLHLGVLDGVGAIHKAGLLHRDIQPSHILIGDDGRIVLRGFGLIKFVDPEDNGDGTLVDENSSATRAALYKAPEQIEEEPATSATDIYAVGVSLYQTLTGQLPFDGPPLEQVLARVSVPPVSVGDRGVSLPPALIQVVDQMIARDPEQRPLTTEVAAAALRNV